MSSMTDDDTKWNEVNSDIEKIDKLITDDMFNQEIGKLIPDLFAKVSKLHSSETDPLYKAIKMNNCKRILHNEQYMSKYKSTIYYKLHKGFKYSLNQTENDMKKLNANLNAPLVFGENLEELNDISVEDQLKFLETKKNLINKNDNLIQVFYCIKEYINKIKSNDSDDQTGDATHTDNKIVGGRRRRRQTRRRQASHRRPRNTRRQKKNARRRTIRRKY